MGCTDRELGYPTGAGPSVPKPMRNVCRSMAIAVAVLSCDSDTPTETPKFSGDYQLESIDGQPLPFIDLLAPLTGDTLFITSGELSVLSRGRLRIVRFTQWRPRNKPAEPITSDTIVRDYRVEGDYVYIDHTTGGLQGPYTDTVEVYNNSFTHRMLVNRYNQGHFWRNMYYIRD